MDRDVASAIGAIGDVVSPETLEASRAVYADAHEQPRTAWRRTSRATTTSPRCYHLNTDDRLLGDQIAAFVQTHAPVRERSERS